MRNKDRKEYYKKYYREHRDKRLARDKLYSKKYYKKHRDEVSARQKLYRETHRNEMSAYYKQWYQKHKDEMLAYSKQWYQQNKDKEIQQAKAWRENHRERYRELKRKNGFKRRRGLGFVCLNEPFEGSDAHHICATFVIYIPKDMHRSIYHNVWTGKNMALINALAFDYLLETKVSEAQGSER